MARPATEIPYRAWPNPDIRIEAPSGKRANLLLLREDPTQTIQAYDEIVKVILHGKVLDRGALAAPARRRPLDIRYPPSRCICLCITCDESPKRHRHSTACAHM